MKKTTKKTTTKAPKKAARKVAKKIAKPSAAKRSGSKARALTEAEHEELLRLLTRTVDTLERLSARVKKVEEDAKHADMRIENSEKISLDAAEIARGANQAVAQVMRAAGEQHTEIVNLQGQVKELTDVLNSVSENNAQIVDSILDTAQAHHERIGAVEQACRGLFPPTGPQETPEDDPPEVEAASPLDPVVTTAAEALGQVVGAAFSDLLTGGRSRRG